MDLAEFISQALKGVIKGVKDAQDFAKESGGRVNPSYDKALGKSVFIRIESDENYTVITDIDFDIAVTASDKKEAGASGGINVLSVKIGGKMEGEHFNETVSRIKFSVSVTLPSTLPYTPVIR